VKVAKNGFTHNSVWKPTTPTEKKVNQNSPLFYEIRFEYFFYNSARVEGLGDDLESNVRVVLRRNHEFINKLADEVVAHLTSDSDVFEDIIEELADIIEKDPDYQRAIVMKSIEIILSDESGKELVVGEGAQAEEAEGYTEEELSEMTMPLLWNICRELGISKKGKKLEVIKRILEAQEALPMD